MKYRSSPRYCKKDDSLIRHWCIEHIGKAGEKDDFEPGDLLFAAAIILTAGEACS